MKISNWNQKIFSTYFLCFAAALQLHNKTLDESFYAVARSEKRFSRAFFFSRRGPRNVDDDSDASTATPFLTFLRNSFLFLSLYPEREEKKKICSNTNVKLPFLLQRKFSISDGNKIFFSFLLL